MEGPGVRSHEDIEAWQEGDAEPRAGGVADEPRDPAADELSESEEARPGRLREIHPAEVSLLHSAGLLHPLQGQVQEAGLQVLEVLRGHRRPPRQAEAVHAGAGAAVNKQ